MLYKDSLLWAKDLLSQGVPRNQRDLHTFLNLSPLPGHPHLMLFFSPIIFLGYALLPS